ncbi:MAG: hypothetical protein EBU46_21550, partial [Nitrosomonadaceae bacterium]|nr:hypothetical protein [Nitrosomonadaceae bacterium]
MSAMIETLMQNGANAVSTSCAKAPEMAIAVHGDMVNAVNHVNHVNAVNTVNAVNNVNLTVNIAPWGAPLSVTESDIEAALCDLPTDIPRTGEMVRALMEVVKRAHLPPEARNVYLNPKRTDQARALTNNGWAFLPLSEATQVLFDGASAQIEKPPAIKAGVGIGQARTALPIHYRMDKANVVQMGMHPMGAHLANMAPGGVGPLLVEGKPAGVAASLPAASPAVPPAASPQERFRKMVSEIPAAYSETGALHPGWIAEVVSK